MDGKTPGKAGACAAETQTEKEQLISQLLFLTAAGDVMGPLAGGRLIPQIFAVGGDDPLIPVE